MTRRLPSFLFALMIVALIILAFLPNPLVVNVRISSENTDNSGQAHMTNHYHANPEDAPAPDEPTLTPVDQGASLAAEGEPHQPQ